MLGVRGRGLGQRTHYFAPGQVLRVKHAAMAMATLPAKVVFEFAVVGSAGLNPGEASAEPDQFAHRLGTLANDGLDGGAIAQAGARAQRVLDMRFERVVNAPHAGDAALRVGGVGLGTAGLGENGDGAGFGRLDREGQARDAAADYQEVAGQLRDYASSGGLGRAGGLNRGARVVSK